EAALALVHERDGVLYRDDMVLAPLVGLVHDGGQSRRLPASRRPRDQHQPLVEHGRLLEDGWQAELVGGEDLGGDLTEDGATTVLMVEEIRAEESEGGILIP